MKKMVTIFLETQRGVRNPSRRSEVLVYIFPRNFVLRWYFQLRLSAENEHFYEETSRFSPQNLILGPDMAYQKLP